MSVNKFYRQEQRLTMTIETGQALYTEKEAAQQTGVTRAQILWLIHEGIITPARNEEGRPRLTERDIFIIEMAGVLKKKGVRVKRINAAALASIRANSGPFLYTSDTKNKPLAIFWDGQSWEVETTALGIGRLHTAAVSNNLPVFYGTYFQKFIAYTKTNKAKEVADEQPKP